LLFFLLELQAPTKVTMHDGLDVSEWWRKSVRPSDQNDTDFVAIVDYGCAYVVRDLALSVAIALNWGSRDCWSPFFIGSRD
jgi:hypothetical protein